MYSFFNKANKLLLSAKDNLRYIDDISFTITGLGTMSWAFSNRNKWVKREVTLFKSRLSQEERDAIEKSPEVSKNYSQKCQDEVREDIMSSVL